MNKVPKIPARTTGPGAVKSPTNIKETVTNNRQQGLVGVMPEDIKETSQLGPISIANLSPDFLATNHSVNNVNPSKGIDNPDQSLMREISHDTDTTNSLGAATNSTTSQTQVAYGQLQSQISQVSITTAGSIPIGGFNHPLSSLSAKGPSNIASANTPVSINAPISNSEQSAGGLNINFSNTLHTQIPHRNQVQNSQPHGSSLKTLTQNSFSPPTSPFHTNESYYDASKPIISPNSQNLSGTSSYQASPKHGQSFIPNESAVTNKKDREIIISGASNNPLHLTNNNNSTKSESSKSYTNQNATIPTLGPFQQLLTKIPGYPFNSSSSAANNNNIENNVSYTSLGKSELGDNGKSSDIPAPIQVIKEAFGSIVGGQTSAGLRTAF